VRRLSSPVQRNLRHDLRMPEALLRRSAGCHLSVRERDQPTPNTVGMLNRAINGKRDPQARQALLSVMERVLKNVRADAVTRERAFDYLVFQAPGALWKCWRRARSGS
jgi:hypothetical protein